MAIYARQISPEYQDGYYLLDDDFCISEGKYIIDGNREFKSYTNEVYNTLCRNIEEMADSYEAIVEKSPYRYFNNVTEILKYYGIEKENGKQWSNKDKKEWKNILAIYNDIYNDEDLICKALSLIYSVDYDYIEIRGSVQSEWQGLYYNADAITNEAIKQIETIYFNTGSEWIVDVENEEITSADEINGFSIYCFSWNADGIRAEIADAAGVSVDDVILYQFAGYSRTACYNIT
jgi:hypothetical protein